MYLAVKDVQAKEDYQLLLSFENGEKRLLDMKPYLNNGVFEELKNESLFKTVRLSFDAIEWENEAGLDPEFLYNYSVAI